MTPFKGRTLNHTLPVRVYRNLHASTPTERWSIVQGRHVVAHAAQVMLEDVRFIVSAAGVARARRIGRKVVCAYAAGRLIGSGMGITATDGGDLPTRVVFDAVVSAFVAESSRQIQTGARCARFNERGCSIAYGVSAA